jgi:tetratricopeptide (TPR) repeat protein
MVKNIIALVFLLCSTLLFAQEKMNFTQVDASSVQLYQKADWPGLIALGKTAQADGVSFYDLDLRMGIAFYKLQRYRNAIVYLEKCNTQFPTDELASEYLYYAYLFGGRVMDAYLFEKTLSASMKERLKMNNLSKIDEVALFGGFYQNQKLAQLKQNNLAQGNGHGEQTLLENFNFENASLTHHTNANVYLTYDFTQINLSQLQQIKEGTTTQQDFEHKVRQSQFFVSATFPSPKGLSYTVALHYLQVRKELTVTKTNPVSFTNTIYNSGEFVGYVDVKKELGNTRLGLSYSYSNLNKTTQHTLGGSLNLYPLGNLKLYSLTNVYFHTWEDVQLQNQGSLILVQKLGVNLKVLSIEVGGTFGKLNDFIAENGMVIYNSSDQINSMYGVTLRVPMLKNKLQLSASYTAMTNENYGKIITSGNQTSYFTNNYSSTLISGGLSWIF